MTPPPQLPPHPVGNYPDIAYAMADVLAGLTATEQDNLHQWLGHKTYPELADGTAGIYIADYRQWPNETAWRKIR